MTETMTEQERHDALYAARRERIQRIMDGYECGMVDTEQLLGNVAFDRKPMRWVLVEESDKWGYFLTGCSDKTDAPRYVVDEHRANGFEPVCIYDLDQLAGPKPEPEPEEGDTVRVIATGETFEAQATRNLSGRRVVVAPDEQGTYHDFEDVEIVALAVRDERMPVRYLLARIETFVAFDSTPAP